MFDLVSLIFSPILNTSVMILKTELDLEFCNLQYLFENKEIDRNFLPLKSKTLRVSQSKVHIEQNKLFITKPYKQQLSQPNPTPTQQQLNPTRLRLDIIITTNPPTPPTQTIQASCSNSSDCLAPACHQPDVRLTSDCLRN